MSDRPGEKRSLSRSLILAIKGEVINNLRERDPSSESELRSSLPPEEQTVWQTNRSFVTRIIQSEIPNFPERLLQTVVKGGEVITNIFSIKLDGITAQDREFWDKLILAPRLSSLNRKWEKDDKGQTLFLEIKRSKDGNSINCSVGKMDHEVMAFDPEHNLMDQRVMTAINSRILSSLGATKAVVSPKCYKDYYHNSTTPLSINIECIVNLRDETQLTDKTVHDIVVQDEQGKYQTYSAGLNSAQKIAPGTFRVVIGLVLMKDYLNDL